MKDQEERDKEIESDMIKLLENTLRIEKGQLNPLRYRDRTNFEYELMKYKWVKTSVWKIPPQTAKSD
jgi:hypothetical protein